MTIIMAGFTGFLYPVRMTSDRPNTDLAAAVDVALLLAEQHGVRAAAAFLADHGAGFALTCRVLAEPGRRRKPTFDLPPLGS